MVALALLIGLAAGTGFLALWMDRAANTAPPTGRALSATSRSQSILSAAELARVQLGAYPGTLASLAAAAHLPPPTSTWTPIWARDPFGAGRPPLDYTIVATAPRELIVSSVGPDGIPGTADDLTYRASDTATGRSQSRRRQRLLNAAYLDSVLLGHGVVTQSTRAEFARQLTLRRHAEAARWGAESAVALAWALVRDAADLELARIRQVNGLTASIPTRAIGSDGMLAAIGRSDALGFDAFGTEWLVGVAGFRSAGGDRTEGGDDDL